MKVVPLRLQPGDDLRLALEAWMGEQQEQAGCRSGASAVSWIKPPATLSCGSVPRLRFEGREPPLHLQEHQPGHPGADTAGPVVE